MYLKENLNELYNRISENEWYRIHYKIIKNDEEIIAGFEMSTDSK